jgi:hypothetical protein
MRTYGFSTGALALGEFRRGLEMLQGIGARAVELSALRDHELPALMDSLSELDLTAYSYVSLHAPSRFGNSGERRVAELLRPCIERGIHVVLHPDVIQDVGCWTDFGELLCIENNDKRKPGRTVDELKPTFEKLPSASWCLDLGHARQVDSTLLEVWRMLREFSDRLREIHLSELNSRCEHEALSMGTVWSIREIAHRIPEVPVILESRVGRADIRRELEMAKQCFERPASPTRDLSSLHAE